MRHPSRACTFCGSALRLTRKPKYVACATCASLIQHGRVNALTSRALRGVTWMSEDISAIRGQLARQFRVLVG